jgi:hypothetical protein
MGRVRTAVVVSLVLCCAIASAGCGAGKRLEGADETTAPTRTATTPLPAPAVVLSENQKRLYAPLPPDRSRIPVLLYHGIGPASDFQNNIDAQYAISAEDFATQMTAMKHAGFQTVSLQTFSRFVAGESVDLPPRPFLLTFDDGWLNSWTGTDGILAKLGFTAVMFVDVGPVAEGNPEYLTWTELQTMQNSGRWELELHAGRRGHTFVRTGSGPDDTGPFYAYKEKGESFDQWKDRAFSDIESGQEELSKHISQYQPGAFAPPFGAYGQEGTNDPRIPQTLLPWLVQRFHLVFTQDRSWFAKPGSSQPLGRFQLSPEVDLQRLHDRLVR